MRNNCFCKQCSKPIYKKPSILIKGGNVYCSNRCYRCSKLVMQPKTTSCQVCGKDIPFNHKYCNNTCQNLSLYINYIAKWKKGLVSGLIGKKYFEISAHLRRYLFEKYNNKCSRCDWNEFNIYTKRIPLQVEHIDGNWENCSESNLTLLCPNCHSLTPTYGGANKGKGRSFRYGK